MPRDYNPSGYRNASDQPSPKSKIDFLQRNIKSLEDQLVQNKQKLEDILNSCQHKWSDPVYDPIYSPAYEIPGDPPGTMGVDWRGPTYVPASSTPRWKRTCSVCGHIEYTTSWKEEVTKLPRF